VAVDTTTDGIMHDRQRAASPARSVAEVAGDFAKVLALVIAADQLGVIVVEIIRRFADGAGLLGVDEGIFRCARGNGVERIFLCPLACARGSVALGHVLVLIRAAGHQGLAAHAVDDGAADAAGSVRAELDPAVRFEAQHRVDQAFVAQAHHVVVSQHVAHGPLELPNDGADEQESFL
jgi:hypothetical protein